MTRKEQIIEVLQKHIFADGDIWVIYDLKKMYDDLLPILALPLDVPSDEEIKDEIFANNPVLDGDPEWIYGFRQGQFSGAKMMRNEIIKRNRVINRDDMNDRQRSGAMSSSGIRVINFQI